jgi:hypothetical protein
LPFAICGAARFLDGREALAKPFPDRAKLCGNGAGHKIRSFLGGEIAKMITLKITALVLGAGILVDLLSQADFGRDFVLAVMACFS